MGGILRARADRIAINITLNSFGTPLNEVRDIIPTTIIIILSSSYLLLACDAHFGS
ncbi:MAG: hypothetical protein RL713_783 [Bacteroidota bacterium]